MGRRARACRRPKTFCGRSPPPRRQHRPAKAHRPSQRVELRQRHHPAGQADRALRRTVVMNMYSLGGVTAEDAKTNGLGNLTMQMLHARHQDAQCRSRSPSSSIPSAARWPPAAGTTVGSGAANCLKGDFAQGDGGLRRHRQQPGVRRDGAGADEEAHRGGRSRAKMPTGRSRRSASSRSSISAR